MLCDNLERLWDEGVGGRFRLEGIYVYLGLIHVAWQKPTQHCKPIILQLKRNLKKKTQKPFYAKAVFMPPDFGEVILKT